MKPRLGVNIDHIATLRQLRGTFYPDLLEAMQLAEKGGAEQITVHLREDRRHIQDRDVELLRKQLHVPLNLEMAASPLMVSFALKIQPDWVCLVPEKRKELTTEGGLDLSVRPRRFASAIAQLKEAGIRVSCFIEPSLIAVKWSEKLGANAVEFHTGKYCLASQKRIPVELERIKKSSLLAHQRGLKVHAGHGFDYKNILGVLELRNSDGSPLIEEYNIGHSIVCRAVLVGLENAVREMASLIQTF